MNYNFLQNNAFVFSLVRLDEVAFRVTAVSVPEITVPPAQAGTPGSSQYFPGTFNEFGELTIQFVVDEDLKNYEQLYRWITQQRFPGTEFTPKNELELPLTADATLITLTNSSVPNRTFFFKEIFPIALGGMEFITTEGDVESVRCTATFKYSYFTLK